MARRSFIFTVIIALASLAGCGSGVEDQRTSSSRTAPTATASTRPPYISLIAEVRPNGTTGWVRARVVNIIESPYRIVVELSTHRITVWNGDAIMLQEPVAIGAPETPTPTTMSPRSERASPTAASA